MKIMISTIIICFSMVCNGQKKSTKIIAYVPSTFYSLDDNNNSLNNTVRHSEAAAIKYKRYDTAKKKGMAYELMFNPVTSYYKNIVGANTVLRVDDMHIMANFITPVIIFYKKNMEHFIGAGIGFGTLAYRDYYDEYGTALQYNNTNLKELKFGKYWTGNFIIDYDFDLAFDKRMGMSFGLRYFTTIPFIGKAADYKVTQGTGIVFKYGVFYKFK